MVQPSVPDGETSKRRRLFVKVLDQAPRVKAVPTVDGGDRCKRVPTLIQCNDLAAAQRISGYLRAAVGDAQLSSPVLLVAYGTTGLGDHRGRVYVPEKPRAIVSLLIDLQLLGIADGIVLVSSSGRASALQDEITQELTARGIDHYGELPGYDLVADLERSDVPRGANVS